MSERKQTRIYCSKTKGAHEVGATFATTQGLVVRYTAAVSATAGIHGVLTEWRPTRDAAESGTAWCASCKIALPIMFSDLHGKSVNLAAEGMWRDPIGVLGRQRRGDRG